MKLAFSSNAFKKTDLADAILKISNIGYKGIEILADIPHAYPPNLSEDDIAYYKNIIKKNGLKISNVNAFTFFAEGDTYHPSWLEKDESLRQKRIEHTINCIKLTSGLGAEFMSLEPGGPLDEQDYETCWKLFKDGLNQVLPIAESHGVKLLVEPEPELLIENSDQMERLLNEISHNNLGFNCDLGHFFCVNEDPVDVIRKFKNELVHIHIEDIAATKIHKHLVPGTGAMDFVSIFAALKEVNYQSFVTVELYPFETTAEEVALEAYNFLSEIIE